MLQRVESGNNGALSLPATPDLEAPSPGGGSPSKRQKLDSDLPQMQALDAGADALVASVHAACEEV